MTHLHALSLLLWILAAGLFVAPLWRMARRRPRYLDGLWCVCLIGVVNRIALASTMLPPNVADLASASLAALFGAVVWGYQRADR